METNRFEQWGILELMGHRRLAGRVTEQEIAGHGFLRLDIPGEGDQVQATQLYAPAAVYAITPVDEATARACAREWTQPPVTQWELRSMLPEPAVAATGLSSVDEDEERGPF